MASPFRAIWKESGEYVLTTGDNHTTAEQVEFNNIGVQEYFVDLTMDLQQFETTWVIQGLVGSLSLYIPTKDGRLVGMSRTGE